MRVEPIHPALAPVSHLAAARPHARSHDGPAFARPFGLPEPDTLTLSALTPPAPIPFHLAIAAENTRHRAAAAAAGLHATPAHATYLDRLRSRHDHDPAALATHRHGARLDVYG